MKLLRQAKAYQSARSLPRKDKRRSSAFGEANKAVGFREYDLHSYAQQFTDTWLGEHLDSLTMQALASRAFKAVQQHAFGRRGRPRFKGYNQLDSVQGKNNISGIRWKADRVEWKGLQLDAIINEHDPVVAHGLSHRVKYVRLVRRKLNGRPRFYVQLVCEGQPYQKPKNKPGEGYVGLDLGPSTIAAVSEDAAFLTLFCGELDDHHREMRRLQRQLDRQRRANNPENYHADGTVRGGKRTWYSSARMRKTQAKLAELHRTQAAYRKSLHGQLVNRIVRLGDVIQLEDISYRAFQRRFGKSVANRAPGMFVETLKRKAESAGGVVNEFPTWHTRLSQTCHHCGTVKKKPLSQRWHVCDCGVAAQRDLYSAFLAMCIDDETLNVGHADEVWPGVDALLRAALRDIQTARNGRLPRSFGLQPEPEPFARVS